MSEGKLASIGGVLLVFITCLSMWGFPKYKVYNRELDGKSRLKEAEWTRKIQIQDAEAKQASAEMLGMASLTKAQYKAKSDSIRAVGTSNANKIIAESLTPEYIRWLFVDQLDQTSNQIIYVPTEANVPIMEAGKR